MCPSTAHAYLGHLRGHRCHRVHRLLLVRRRASGVNCNQCGDGHRLQQLAPRASGHTHDLDSDLRGRQSGGVGKSEGRVWGCTGLPPPPLEELAPASLLTRLPLPSCAVWKHAHHLCEKKDRLQGVLVRA